MIRSTIWRNCAKMSKRRRKIIKFPIQQATPLVHEGTLCCDEGVYRDKGTLRRSGGVYHDEGTLRHDELEELKDVGPSSSRQSSLRRNEATIYDQYIHGFIVMKAPSS